MYFLLIVILTEHTVPFATERKLFLVKMVIICFVLLLGMQQHSCMIKPVLYWRKELNLQQKKS